MTYKEFLKQLRKLRGKFEFVNRGGGVRLRSYRVNYDGARVCLCPIEAVALMNGDADPTFMSSLDLAPKVRDAIIGAADGRGYRSGRHESTQRDILRVLGLAQPESWKP